MRSSLGRVLPRPVSCYPVRTRLTRHPCLLAALLFAAAASPGWCGDIITTPTIAAQAPATPATVLANLAPRVAPAPATPITAPAAPTPVPPVSVTIARLHLQAPEPESQVITSSTGFVVPGRKVEIAPRLSGRVLEVLAERGDHVEKGAPLVRIDERDYAANVERCRAAVTRAEARLQEMRTGPRPQEIDAAEADLQLAEAMQSAAKRRVARLRPLVEQRIENQQSFDSAETELLAAIARTNAARKRVELLKLGPRIEQIRVAEADLAEARTNLVSADATLSECVVRAPMAGIILERHTEVGELVPKTVYDKAPWPINYVILMADMGGMEVESDVNQADYGRIAKDQTCTVTLESNPSRPYAGRVVQISPKGNRQNQTVQLRVRILDADENVKPELTSRVAFYTIRQPRPGDPPKVFAPAASVVEREGAPTVMVAEGNNARIRRVRTGPETAGKGVQIVEGLSGNETVVIQPPPTLTEGANISPTPKAP